MNPRSLTALIGAALLTAAPATLRAAGPLNVVTTTEDLASIAREVGGDKIKGESLSRGYQDPHFAQANPSFVIQLDRANVSFYAQREEDFEKRLSEAERRWLGTMAPYKGVKVVTYHRSWPNFADRFGLEIIGYVEPKPGIPPSPSHTIDLIQEMK